jgi:ribosome modulation factor
MNMTALEQAAAVVAEFIADASRQSHKMATGFRSEVFGSFNGTEYRCVRANGRVNWYVGGKLASVKNAVIALTESLQAERDALDALLAANEPVEKTDAVSQGRDAYAAGHSLDHCNPFVEGSVLAQEWAQGWQEAQDAEWSAKALAEVEKAEALAMEFKRHEFEVDGVKWSVEDDGAMFWYRDGVGVERAIVLRQLSGL